MQFVVNRTGGVQMKILRKTLFVVLAGTSVFSVASTALAQEVDAAREAAIRKCVQIAKSVPEGKSPDNQLAAVAAFKACMTAAGHRP
jgi:hypothetical protein